VTVRDYLNRYMCRATILCWIAVLVAVVNWLASQHNIRAMMLLIVGIFVAAGSYPRCLTLGVRRSKTTLSLALGEFGVRLAIPSSFRSFPSCRLSYDTARDQQ